MYTVYILKSGAKQGWSYVGYSNNMNRRLKEHNWGKVLATKGYRPVFIAYAEEHASADSARTRELYLKSGYGREEKKTLLEQ